MEHFSAKQVKPRVRPSEIWGLGPNRILCGDATNGEDISRLFEGQRASLAVTSPPYNLGGGKAAFLNRAKARSSDLSSKYSLRTDNAPEADYRDMLVQAIENALLVSDMAIVVIQQLSGNKIALIEFLHQLRHHLVDTAIWDKEHAPPALARRVMNSQFEFLLLFSPQFRPSRSIPMADFHGTVSNVYSGTSQRRNQYAELHGATFPIHLPLWLIHSFDSSGGIVFDPFLGTSTTLMAAHKLGRVCYGIEIEPGYCDLVLDRWEKASGMQAERLATRRNTTNANQGHLSQL